MTEKDFYVINKYKEGLSMMDISRELGYLSDSHVRTIFRRYNIKTRNASGGKNLHLNHSYFEAIDTENKAYFLGLMISDGCVSEREGGYRQPAIQLKFEKTDEYILKEFKKELNTTNKVMTKDVNYRALNVHSSKMAEDLAKYGVVPNKTLSTRLPLISEELMPHLVRGLIDGDGWISQITSTGKYVIGLCSASMIVEDVMYFLNKELGLPILTIKDRGESKGKDLHYQAQGDVKALANYLYEDANIYFDRKRKVIEHML